MAVREMIVASENLAKRVTHFSDWQITKKHLLSHTNKCTNYIIYYLKSVLTIDIKTLSNFHSSYMFRHITCHPQGALIFLAKITGKLAKASFS
jgi:hypothetical protein